MPKLEKAEFYVEVESLGEQAQPVVITQSEYMRRMKDMSRYQQGMGFYAQMPDAYNLVLNADHPLIKKVIADETAKTAEALKPVLAEIKGQEARLTILRQEQNKKKPEEITQEEKDDLSNTQKAIDEHKNQKKQIIADAAKDNKIVHQLIDLALLQNGMLRGEALDKFLKRSVELIG
jgi:molecular chaperone HtpG